MSPSHLPTFHTSPRLEEKIGLANLECARNASNAIERADGDRSRNHHIFMRKRARTSSKTCTKVQLNLPAGADAPEMARLSTPLPRH